VVYPEIHDRMPVLLRPEQFEPWLSGQVGIEYLKPAPNDLLQKWQVSNCVNSSKASADDPSLIDEVAPLNDQVSKDPGITGQQDLF
jgi:putative SOS response-associated peptidase YedK